MRIGAMVGDITRSLFKAPFTERYPFERKPAPDRLRGRLEWDDETCTGCKLCAKDCPAAAVEIFVLDKKARKFVLRFHAGRCTFCAQCEVTCKFDSIALSSSDWELAGLDRRLFVQTFGKPEDVKALQERESAEPAPVSTS